MSNTLGGINLAQIAQETLAFLRPQLPLLSAFTTDFSSEVAQKGQSVTTRVATSQTADDVSGGFTASAATSTAKTITLDQELGKALSFTSAELSKGGMDLIRRVFMPVATHATLRGVVDYVLGLVTTANFSSTNVVAAASFDADKLADTAKILQDLNVGPNRFGILKPAYWNSLVKDNAIQNVAASGDNNALVNYDIRKCAGFNLYQYTNLPANSQALECVFGGKEGLIVAARMPALPDITNIVEVENVVDSETGFPLQIQLFYVPKERSFYIAIATLFGASVGVASNITKITSA